MKIYQLIIQTLNEDLDKDFDSNKLEGLSYICHSLGYFSSIEKVKNVLQNLDELSKDDFILNIYTRNFYLDVNVDDNKEWEDYTFFDLNGNIIDEINDNMQIKEPILNIGDCVYYIPDADVYKSCKIKYGIISQEMQQEEKFIYDSSDHCATVLLGTEIHNHVHPHERWLRKMDITKRSEWFIKTLKDRLEKIGY